MLIQIPKKALLEDRIRSYFAAGCKRAADRMVGVEWEKIGVYRESGLAIRYAGERGVEAIFERLVARFGWTPVRAGGRTVALKKDGSSITLEPGGQIELSGAKACALDENVLELYAHLEEVKEVSEPLGIVWLGLGLQPFSRLEDIEWSPKPRYRIMREGLGGELTQAMMKQTASIQISLDYMNEADAAGIFRLANALSPLLTALFANSPLACGRPSGWLSRRAHIWTRTAPERTGFVPAVFKPRFGFGDYLDYALRMPMLFIVRGGRWIPARGTSFQTFLKNGLGPYHAAEEDWELHLTTIFTDVRLKRYVEIRMMDCQKKELGLSAPALLKGIFYDPVSRRKAGGLFEGMTAPEWKRLKEEAAVKGLEAVWRGKSLLGPARRLTDWSEEGLKRLAGGSLALEREARYLMPLKKMLQKGVTPAEELLAGLPKNRPDAVRYVLERAAI